jgi:hypothetical protein
MRSPESSPSAMPLVSASRVRTRRHSGAFGLDSNCSATARERCTMVCLPASVIPSDPFRPRKHRTERAAERYASEIAGLPSG